MTGSQIGAVGLFDGGREFHLSVALDDLSRLLAEPLQGRNGIGGELR